ncbi:calcium-binding protein [Chelatococcus sambhunathii]|uniref:Calcium-binding protein n=1 Tax=Chelatococcus sambhunathii TaxID=363953 RepID=A0ABU1DAI4_9HYPH|nr:calcium-binding protein [Chelatococcus sambhunathii]MDR4305061.1 calcium-binding protein [Chelatococcus sambhunathii]
MAATAEEQSPAAAAASTSPRQLTKPKSGTGDSSSEHFFSAIGVKKGALLGWTNMQSSPFVITANAQRVGADGRLDGKPMKLEAGFIEGGPKFVDLGGDKIGALWKSGGASLKAAVIDAKKGKAGNSVTVLASQNASFVHDMALLGKDKVAAVTRRAPGFNDEDTVLIVMNAKTLKPAGSPKIIEDDVPAPLGAATYEQAITSYDGGAVALFRDKDAQITGVPVNAKGKTGKPFQVNSTALLPFSFLSSYAGFRVKGAELDDGGYVAAWTLHDVGNNLNFDIRARVFDKKGKPVGPDFIVNQDLVGSQVGPEILPLKKGFAVAWNDKATLGFVTQIVRYFDGEGEPISDEIVTQYFDAGVPFPSSDDSDSARLPGDAYLKVYGSNGSSGVAALYADGLPAPKIGSDEGETTDGGSAAETIIAAGGDDDVDAGSGDDTVDGGDGEDTIAGGPGRNLIIGGLGDDEITAGADAEVFVFSPGQGTDVITGFGADDRIDVSAFQYNQKGNVRLDAKQDGADVLITLDGVSNPAKPVTVVRLKNKALAEFTDDNIIL